MQINDIVTFNGFGGHPTDARVVAVHSETVLDVQTALGVFHRVTRAPNQPLGAFSWSPKEAAAPTT